MYRRKIVWLGMLCLLPVSMDALAADTKVLVGRAHHWHKLGRTELEIKAWREVLSAEPGNAEAKAGLAKALEQDKATAGDPIADWLAEPGAAPHAASGPPYETTPAIGSAVADKAAAVNETATAAKTEPGVNAAPVVESATAVEAVTEVKVAPVVESKPAIETKPVAETAQLKLPVPTGSPAPVVEKAAEAVKATEVVNEPPQVTAHGETVAVEPLPATGPAPIPAAVAEAKPVPETEIAHPPAVTPAPAIIPATALESVVPPATKPVESVPAIQPVAQPAAARASGNVDLGAIQAELKSAQTERLSESRLLGLKKTQPDAVVQGGSLTPGNTASSQALLERAAYWDKHGRRDLAKKLRQQARADSPDEPATAVSTASAQPAAAVESSTNAIEPAQVNPITSPEPTAPTVPTETLAQSIVAKPTRQELTERAKYWEVRGRNDLAEKLSIQAAKAEPAPAEAAAVPAAVALPPASALSPASAAATTPSQPAAGSPAVAVTAPTQPTAGNAAAQPASAATPDSRSSLPQVGTSATLGSELAAQPSRQEMADKAKYWAEHGRPDLAEQLRQKLQQPAKAAAPEKAPEVGIVKAQEGTGTLGSELAIPPSRQDIADKAQYWAAHGRNDLAEQLKKKLQQMQPDRRLAAAQPYGGSAGDQDAKRSALEDYLLKNPNSLKARLDLAQIYRSIGEFAKAREQIDSVLTLSPDLPDALFASAQLYADQRLWWETLQTLEKISPVARTQEMGRLQKIGWAHVQIDRADAMVRQGDNRGAELLLRQVAAELVVNYNETALPEPPPLWKSGAPQASKKAGRTRKR